MEIGKRRALRAVLIVAVFVQLALVESLARASCPDEAVRYSSTSQRLYISGADTVCTLTDLDAFTSSTVLHRVSSTGKVWFLKKHLFVEKGATLVLHGDAAGGDVNELRLRSDSGFEVIVRADHGTIDIDSTKITSWNESAGGPDTDHTDGRAYIHVRSRRVDGEPRESRMDIRDSDIGYLGYNGSEAYGLAWKVSGSGDGLYDEVDVLGDVTGSRIHHNYFGAYTYGAFGMQWIGNDFDKNVKYGLDPHDDSDHLVVVGNDFSNNGNHGFICSKRCNDLEIRDNRAWNNTGNGFMLHRSVTDSVMEGNEAWDNSDSGLALFDVSDNVIRDNYFHDNRRGIRLSVGARDNLIEDNVLDDNEYGLYFFRSPNDAPAEGDDGRPKRNTIVGNVITGSYRAIVMKESDDNEVTGNDLGPSTDDEAVQFIDGTGNVFASNDIGSDQRIHIKTSKEAETTVFLTQAGGPQGSLLIDVSGAARAVFVETEAITHRTGTAATRATDDESTLTLTASGAKTVSVVPIYARPSSGTVLIVPSSSTAWTARSTSGTRTTTFTVGKRTPGASYRVKKDGGTLETVTASSEGVVTFTDDVGETTVSYSVTAN